MVKVKIAIELRSDNIPISGVVELYVDDVYWKSVLVVNGYYDEITEIHGYKIMAIYGGDENYEGAIAEAYIPYVVVIKPKADVGIGREKLYLIKLIPKAYPLTDWKRELCRRIVYMCKVNRVVDDWTWLFYVYRERYRFYKDRRVSAFIASLKRVVFSELRRRGYLKLDEGDKYVVVSVPKVEELEEIVQMQIIDVVRG